MKGTSKAALSRVAQDRVAAEHRRERQMGILERAWAKGRGVTLPDERVTGAAERSLRQVYAAVYAVIPGRQNNRNAGDYLKKGIAAAARSIRAG